MTHENIIKLYKYSENETEISLIMEYANQATYLQELILEQHTPIDDEQELQIFALDILRGIAYIHKQGAIHCDIKLENMLAHKEADDTYPIIKICDFGLSHNVSAQYNHKAVKKNTVGTWGYIAPEVKRSDYIGPEIDMWAYGLILYEMAVAYKPTQVKNYKYEDGDLPFRKNDWRGKPEELKLLITGCMNMDPELRLTAEDALRHPYFSTQV
jgi:serine/threonine protein kinase